ncbi:MAG: LysR substrate-binding domain-containing protein [Vulcanimicrobiaceae bacterium]
MDLRTLRYFLAVAEQQQFTKAAKTLNVAQPSLSYQIKKLERELGVQLLHRTKRSVSVTAAGRILVEEVRVLLAQFNSLVETTKLVATGTIGDLSIGFVESAALAMLPDVVRELRKHHPQVSVRLHQMTTTEQIAGLRKRVIDVGIIRSPVPDPHIETRFLQRESLVVALPDTHKLVHRKRLSLQLLKNELFIAYAGSRYSRLHNEIVSLCRQAGFTPSVEHYFEEWNTICGVVATGAGIAIVPSSVATITIKGVTFRKLLPEVPLHYYVAWLREARSPSLARFLALPRFQRAAAT